MAIYSGISIVNEVTNSTMHILPLKDGVNISVENTNGQGIRVTMSLSATECDELGKYLRKRAKECPVKIGELLPGESLSLDEP